MLIRFYKPFGVLCQFRDPHRPTLADYLDRPGVYPAGRLDRDSEGLLLLTDDGALQARIAHPRYKLPKHYWAQVEVRRGAAEVRRGAAEVQPSAAEVDHLRRVLQDGVELRDGLARAESLRLLQAPDLPPREPPVTPHRAARASWLEVVLTSGRNRQVRRMLAAVGMPVLRLHRARIGPVELHGLEPGQWEEIEPPPAWLADLPRGDSSRSGEYRVRGVRPRRPSR